MKTDSPASTEAWAIIEQERRRDRLIRRVSVIAWTTTLVILLFFAVIIGVQVAQTAKLSEAGAVAWTAVFWSAMPLVVVLGIISLLIATLSTIGIFLRLRTASLAEIQLRLAALEGMLTSRPG